MMAHDLLVTTRRRFLAIVGAAAASLGSVFAWCRVARAAPPVWSTIPDQTWLVGQSVHLDLADYVTDSDGDALSFALDVALPQGVTLTGSVISGTPEATMAATTYVATADDGQPADLVAPGAPTNLTVE